MKRVFALLLALVMVFSMAGCKKKVTVKMNSGKCGTFEIDGTLGNTGTVKLTGTVFDNHNLPCVLKNVAYTYKRSGNSVTMTRKDIASAPKTISGTYNAVTNTFVLDKNWVCQIVDR